ncbi:hypothetical protein GJAV_G00085050 [Gymnothorax javanicus]|nr:hypothetical protein GJAV_G00085050 [Gymnothorax javanicus]
MADLGRRMERNEKYLYFIIVKGYRAGRLCYCKEGLYEESKSASGKFLKVKILDLVDNFIELDELQPLKKQEAEFLYALDYDKERLKAFMEREGLEHALKLAVNSEVLVEVRGEWCQGIIRYIGEIKLKTCPEPIEAAIFGIELQGKDKGKGTHDGSYGSVRCFNCARNSGVFVPFTKVRLRNPKPPGSPGPSESPKPLESLKHQTPVETVDVGDRVTFFMNDDPGRSGMVMAIEEECGVKMVLISPDLNEKNDSAEAIRIPLGAVIREELLSAAGPTSMAHSDMKSSSVDPARDVSAAEYLSLNTVVEVELSHGKKVYGTVRWIGELPGMEGIRVGLELEEPGAGVSDGMLNGRRYFVCSAKRGLFVKLDSCRPDSRFQDPRNGEGTLSSRLSNKHTERNGMLDTAVQGTVAPLSSEQVLQRLVGRMKGIQGHCNSCYMDSALFSLFSCSSVLDSLLYMSTHRQDEPVQTTLLQLIVNPLRSKGFVPSENVMRLRRLLQDGGHSDHTFTTEEKDPEEFLTLVMHQILQLDPLLRLQSAGGKVQENYCYQIFLDQKHSLVLPTVQQLLEHSLHCAELTLAEVPSCLILQMPRYGKNFKMFDKIIPSLELDISDLLSENPRECVLCGQLAVMECNACFTDPTFGRTGFKQFCAACSDKVHQHPSRRSHQPSRLVLPDGFPPAGGQVGPPREKLQLFAVLCIETSHYVSFVRHGPGPGDWLFFDSMADREGDQDGYNIPQVLRCPEVERYLKMSPSELATQSPREMEGVAKRLFCDAYMYLYQSPRMSLYR